MDTANNSFDSTLRPDMGHEPTLRVDVNNDRTLRADMEPMPQADDANDVTLRTLRPEPHTEQKPLAPEECFVLKGEEYAKKSCLSDNSGEAQVFLVEREGREFVLKVYYPNFDVNKKLLQTISNFQFEMIVSLIDFGKTYVDGKHRNYELMEYLRGGSLQDYNLRGDLAQFRRIALQAAAALSICHKNNILHKDIKPGNFFFRDKDHRELVLGDFGISSMLEHDGKTFRTTQARTPIYAAPEMYSDVIDGEVEVTPAADFYSLGITLFAVWLGENPMSANERSMMRQKSEGRLPRLTELPDRVRQIVQGLTAVNPQSRWKYEEVERWFLGEDVPIDISSPFLRYKTFIVDPDRNLVAENVHELIPLLLDNERLAQNYLYSGRIASWLESCGNVKLATSVKDIVANRYPADQKAGLMAAVYAMEPTYPYKDVTGAVCDDTHDIALSLLGSQGVYAIELQNPNDRLFVWLESHTKLDVNRLRSYFKPEADGRVAVLKVVYEVDDEIPFLARCPSSTVAEIVHAYGHAKLTEDDWRSLVDGRLLAWMYAHEDIMACETLRILTQDQPYSQALAYKVLYNMDRTAAYDLRDTQTAEDIGRQLAGRLRMAEHMPADELAHEMEDFLDPEGRFVYYAQMHGWNDLIAEAHRCFDLTSLENRDRLSAYDTRTALYRFCRVLGVTPTYVLPNGTELTNGREIDSHQASFVKAELRNGSIAQWLSVFYHEDPTRAFEEEYSYERELESWVMMLGSYDNQQQYYRRFVKAKEETAQRKSDVRKLWLKARVRARLWRYTFYGLCAAWILLVLVFGITGHQYLLYDHWAMSILLPVGGMASIIIGVRSFFQGYGFLMSMIWGCLGVVASLVPVYALRYMEAHHPSYFNLLVVGLTLLFMIVVHFTDFRRDNRADASLIKDLLSDDDLKGTLLDPLYYTFKTKSSRYKSAKFGLLDDVSDQMRSYSGETSIHYALCSVLMAVLIAMFCAFSPSVLDMKLPGGQPIDTEQILENIQNQVNE